MKEIELVNNKGVALVDDSDFKMLSRYSWCILQQKHTSYAVAGIKRNDKWTMIRMHRLLMNEPKGLQVDHIDGNGLNNQRSNIRLCTNTQNLYNKKVHKNCKSGFKGVRWHDEAKKWQTRVTIDGKQKSIGYFFCLVKAAKVYDNAAREYYGKFARLNFPKDGEQECREQKAHIVAKQA